MTQYLDAPVFDREAVLEMVDGEVELVQIFLEDLPTQLESLRASRANADADAVQKVGHGLKGSIGNLGGRRAQCTISDLEQQARRGHLDDTDQLFDQCEVELQAFQIELNNFMNEAAC